MDHNRPNQWPSELLSNAQTALWFSLLVVIITGGAFAGAPQVIGSPGRVIAVVGDNVILPCSLSPPINAENKTVVWTRPDLARKNVHRFRNGRNVRDDKNPSYNYRTALLEDQMKNGIVSLKLFTVRLKDEGNYTCLIPNVNEAVIQLIVVAVSQPKISILGPDGTGVVLRCEAKGWYPEPEVEWRDMEGRILSANDTKNDTGGHYTVSSTVSVKKTNTSRFTCRVHLQRFILTREEQIHVPGGLFPMPGNSSASHGSAVGGVVGGVVGGFFLFLVIGAITYMYLRMQDAAVHEDLEEQRDRNRKEREDLDEQRDCKKREREDLEEQLDRNQQQIDALQEQLDRVTTGGCLDYETITRKHAVDVTLDPATAHPRLILSADEKQVTRGEPQDLSDSSERFKILICVLAKEGFSSGRFYYEVQVENEARWSLGVVRKSIDRKGNLTQSPRCGFWSLWSDGNKYAAKNVDFVRLSLEAKAHKVGVFVDYEKGNVSFYDVHNKSHIYSYTGYNFNQETLYPFFRPRTAAPLVICPVELESECQADIVETPPPVSEVQTTSSPVVDLTLPLTPSVTKAKPSEGSKESLNESDPLLNDSAW